MIEGLLTISVANFTWVLLRSVIDCRNYRTTWPRNDKTEKWRESVAVTNVNVKEIVSAKTVNALAKSIERNSEGIETGIVGGEAAVVAAVVTGEDEGAAAQKEGGRGTQVLARGLDHGRGRDLVQDPETTIATNRVAPVVHVLAPGLVRAPATVPGRRRGLAHVRNRNLVPDPSPQQASK